MWNLGVEWLKTNASRNGKTIDEFRWGPMVGGVRGEILECY